MVVGSEAIWAASVLEANVMERIGLQEAIGELRRELSESIQAAVKETLRFEVGEITLEFQVEVQRTREGSGGLKFWVVELGGKGSHSTTRTHTITIPLKPMGRTGGPVLTGGDEVPR
jgi:Trypsin-co-occurring domain 2